ncbi:hypothetical protein K491DRAFT_688746 [Lophiostoma macrostomum CBS 122681]|uniref:RING-type domain-containing protein n=1 Tax=Lophiostoma macrostomum CBS 122681 TaxID=1314788 RepID=A0A6A6TIM1_9PLEO|nr:hypothetical protein K491DRAFT_688746 [Lophiostoma macrostomum CBS 122681]
MNDFDNAWMDESDRPSDFGAWRERFMAERSAGLFNDIGVGHRPSIAVLLGSIKDLYEAVTGSKEEETPAAGELVCDICFEDMTILPVPTSLGGGISLSGGIRLEHAESPDILGGAPPPERAVSLKKCGHTFGEACLTKWLRQSLLLRLSPTCPLCRTQLRDDLPLSRQGHWDMPTRPAAFEEDLRRPRTVFGDPAPLHPALFDGRVPELYRPHNPFDTFNSPPTDNAIANVASEWDYINHSIERGQQIRAAAESLRTRYPRMDRSVVASGPGRRVARLAPMGMHAPSLTASEDLMRIREQRAEQDELVAESLSGNLPAVESLRPRMSELAQFTAGPPGSISFPSRHGRLPYPEPTWEEMAQLVQQPDIAQLRAQTENATEARRRALEAIRERARQRSEQASGLYPTMEGLEQPMQEPDIAQLRAQTENATEARRRALEAIRERARQRSEQASGLYPNLGPTMEGLEQPMQEPDIAQLSAQIEDRTEARRRTVESIRERVRQRAEQADRPHRLRYAGLAQLNPDNSPPASPQGAMAPRRTATSRPAQSYAESHRAAALLIQNLRDRNNDTESTTPPGSPRGAIASRRTIIGPPPWRSRSTNDSETVSFASGAQEAARRRHAGRPRETRVHTTRSDDPEASAYSVNYGRPVGPRNRANDESGLLMSFPARNLEDEDD